MILSVVIPSYNGAKKLPGIINALKGQSYKNFEVIFVLDGSTDESAEVIRNQAEGLKYKLIEQENAGRSVVRNRGAKEAKGDLLIFFDDDMLPLPNCIQEHIRHHEKHPSSLMGGAQVDDLKKATTSFQKYKCYLSSKWAEPLREIEEKPLPLERMHLTAANFSIPNNIFQQLNGFDETLRDNEDFDLAIRAFKKDFSVYYRHSAFAWHNDFPSCKSFIKRQMEYRIYHEHSLKNNKEAFDNISRFTPKKLSIGKKMFYSFWKFNWWVTAVDEGLLGWIAPKLQYKIYDWIVYAHLINSNEIVNKKIR